MIPTLAEAVEVAGPFCPGWPDHPPDCLCDVLLTCDTMEVPPTTRENNA